MRVIETMEQQMRLNITKSDYNMTQNTKMMDQLIKAQDRRDLDPALMDIPTFSGDQPEKCLEWVTRIKNICRQSGRSFQQELTNKSGLVVQNFLATMDNDISDSERIEKVLQMFSDIPTTTQAIAKLKALRQGENESILAYNQRYRILVERVEGRTIEQITSPVAMEMYLGTIIPPLRKKQERLKQDGNRTTICQTVISQDTRKRMAIVMQGTRQTWTFHLVDKVTSLITQPDKRVHHHQVTGQWIQTTEATRQLVD